MSPNEPVLVEIIDWKLEISEHMHGMGKMAFFVAYNSQVL